MAKRTSNQKGGRNMKKIIVCSSLLIFIWIGVSYSQSKISHKAHIPKVKIVHKIISPNPGPEEYQIYSNAKPRILTIYRDYINNRLTKQYFTDNYFEPRRQFLGEEIYESGQKIIDTFIEND